MVSPPPTRERALYSSVLKVVLLEGDDSGHVIIGPLSPRAEVEVGVCVGERGKVRLSLEERLERLFVYEATVEAADYPRLKEEQSLRVEFASFPHHLVGLLKKCERDENGTGEGDKGFGAVVRLGDVGWMEIMESNEFRSLGHIRLPIIKASDDVVKVSLAERLKRVEKEARNMRNALEEREKLLGEREQDMRSMHEELARIRKQTEEVHKEKAFWTRDKEQLAYKANQVPALEERLKESERKLRQLVDVEQELHSKVDLVHELRTQLEESEMRRRKAEEEGGREKQQCVEALKRVRGAVEEVRKGNEVIERLEKEAESLRGRSRIRGSIITRQEQLIKENEGKIGNLERELRRAREKLEICEMEKSGVERRLERANAKLEENSNLLRDDGRIIRYLNRKLNEKMIGKGARVLPGGNTSSRSGDSEDEIGEVEGFHSRWRGRSKSASPPKSLGPK